MFFLPKAPPLFENLETTHQSLPNILSKLSTANFTGYINFTFPSSTTLMVFESGKLSSVFLEKQDGTRQTSLDAIMTLAAEMLSTTTGSINAYKLSSDLAARIRVLLKGKIVFMAQELRQFNIKNALEKIKNDRTSGCLRIYTDGRSALIFYKDGAPQGFFHDGSPDIETTATESQKIASLPGAMIDFFSTQAAEDLMNADLLELINIQKLWDCAVACYLT